MTCDELERIVQALSTSCCFVSNCEIWFILDWPETRRDGTQRRLLHNSINTVRILDSNHPDNRHCSEFVLEGVWKSARRTSTQSDSPLSQGAPRQRRVLDVHSGAQTLRSQVWVFLGEAKERAAEPADKPGSVVDSHSSRRNVTVTLEQPTRTRRGPRHEVPIWSCSRWGLPCRPVARLAVRSYRTISPLPSCRSSLGRYLSVALSVGSRRPGVTWHRALWSPDFPRHPHPSK